MTLRVRPARISDAPAIARMIDALLAWHRFSHRSGGAAVVRRLAFGRRRRFRVLIAERGRKPAGMAIVYPGYDNDSASPGLLLSDLYVAPHERRSGVGRALMAAAAAEAKRDGGDWLFFFVAPDNTGAQAFYRRLGARRLPTLPLAIEGAAFAELATQGVDEKTRRAAAVGGTPIAERDVS